MDVDVILAANRAVQERLRREIPQPSFRSRPSSRPPPQGRTEMSFHLAGSVKVVAIREHSRTIRGHKDPTSGASLLDFINLGWFIHLEFDGGIYAFHYGTDKPTGITEG